MAAKKSAQPKSKGPRKRFKARLNLAMIEARKAAHQLTTALIKNDVPLAKRNRNLAGVLIGDLNDFAKTFNANVRDRLKGYDDIPIIPIGFNFKVKTLVSETGLLAQGNFKFGKSSYPARLELIERPDPNRRTNVGTEIVFSLVISLDNGEVLLRPRYTYRCSGNLSSQFGRVAHLSVGFGDAAEKTGKILGVEWGNAALYLKDLVGILYRAEMPNYGKVGRPGRSPS